METDEYFTIGQVAKMCDINIQTLRYYDKQKLVVPASTDESSGYRLYSVKDVLRIKIVQDLRSMQFSLNQISEMLGRGDNGYIIRKMKDKQVEVIEKVRELNLLIDGMGHRIQRMEGQHELSEMSKDTLFSEDVIVELKTYPERIVAFDRRRGPSGLEPYILRVTELTKIMQEHGLSWNGFVTAVYHEDMMSYDRSDGDVELFVPVVDPEVDETQIPQWLDLPFVRKIEGGLFLTATFKGISSEEKCKNVTQMMRQWMEQASYKQIGPEMEQYTTDLTQMENTDNFITELQIPVRKY